MLDLQIDPNNILLDQPEEAEELITELLTQKKDQRKAKIQKRKVEDTVNVQIKKEKEIISRKEKVNKEVESTTQKPGQKCKLNPKKHTGKENK
ncbi:unnamed protein product [Arctia plantaginis]|uniref:Uncharacterized protein n=1 Tax=Arctia plantaginis TaxID=874455 RepID=A0A8S0Z1K3_ARCPL|nr:unnamed protein product [Arctia plantaginis]